jgi:hypothetical protein
MAPLPPSDQREIFRMPASRVSNTATTTREFRLDPLALARLEWLQSLFESHGFKPSASVMARRALAIYVDHVEATLPGEATLQSELIRLKACTSTEQSPFSEPNRFNGTPFSVMWKQATEAQYSARFRRVFGSDLRPRDPQSAQWRQIWQSIDGGEA